ncbi:MAG: glycoside hydrolase family 27 protein [Alphaproteobacteria bacterium]|nr:glycoside hydrolase family 27 protein [Alphaproteobacteria bacterium]
MKLPLPPLRDVAANGLMRIPPMGWASRQRLGTDIDDAAIRQAADGLDETPLKAAGYTYVEIGEGWQGTRDASGAIRGNTKFPDMKALGDHIHTRGLQFGLTISAAPKSCNGFEGSYGHEAEDARTFASWGVDFLIYDWCGAESIYPTQAEQQAAYQKMAEALRASGRDIAFAIDQDGAFNVGTWAAKAGANLWRTGKDIADNWPSVAEAGFKPDTSDAPARWADPGLVQIGNGGMTENEYRTHLNLWAVRGAPLMLGNDVRIMRPETVTLLTNREVIAIDQDAGGRQGKRVAQVGQTEVWAKPLADGSTAVAFFNRGDASAPVAVSWQQLGLAGPRQVRDLWWHENIGSADNRYVVFLTARTSLLLRFSR